MANPVLHELVLLSVHKFFITTRHSAIVPRDREGDRAIMEDYAAGEASDLEWAGQPRFYS
jgi:hypothetical protein